MQPCVFCNLIPDETGHHYFRILLDQPCTMWEETVGGCEIPEAKCHVVYNLYISAKKKKKK